MENLNGRERLRAELLAKAPKSYSPLFHLLFPSLAGSGLIAISLLLIRSFHAWQLLTIPAALVMLNALEWWIHKDILHKRKPPLGFLYQHHTPEHHMIFTVDDMVIRSTRDFQLVLIPPWAILAAFVTALPIPVVLAAIGQWNLGMLFMATTMFYVMLYEWLHLSYHLPTDSFVGRQKFIKFLGRHHTAHHDQSLMQKWNFNVSFPLWDRILGTTYKVK